MGNINFGSAFFSGILNNEYLREVYSALLERYARTVFHLPDTAPSVVDVEDALVFADLLSKSTDPDCSDAHQSLGQEIAVLIAEMYPSRESTDYLGSVLRSTGNILGADLKTSEYVSPDVMERMGYEMHKHAQRVPGRDDSYFLKGQREIFEHLDDPVFSYSAPTSLGKSFLMRTFIECVVKSGRRANIAIMVPTNALINETAERLTDDLGMLLSRNGYCIATRASAMAGSPATNTILVMTPERLMGVLQDPSFEAMRLDYLFVDEAHKISKADSRSALYYSIVDRLAGLPDPPHIVFASPNVPNPDIYLRLAGKEASSVGTSLRMLCSPVFQEVFFIDLGKRELAYYNRLEGRDTLLGSITAGKCLFDFVSEMSKDGQCIVFDSSKRRVMRMAETYSSRCPVKNDRELEELAISIREEIHDSYRLAEHIRRGVAYHTGPLPAFLRLQIEDLYRQGKIDVLFCTNTLLEGVNLPVQNLFVLSDKIGPDPMNPIDFRNLIGRVGRIDYNLFGNVFLVTRNKRPSRKRYRELLEGVQDGQSLSITEFLKKDEQKAVIADSVINGSARVERLYGQSDGEYAFARQIANMLHKGLIDGSQGIVQSEFKHYISDEDRESVRRRADETGDSPDEDLPISREQKEAVEKMAADGVLSYPEYRVGQDNSEAILELLKQMAETFQWRIYEQHTFGSSQSGQDEYENLVPYARLIDQWVGGATCKSIICSNVADMLDRHEMIPVYEDDGYHYRMEPFLGTPSQISDVADNTLSTIENAIRFNIGRYLQRMTREIKKSNPLAADNDWAQYVEYGAVDETVIWLQKRGFTRECAYRLRREGYVLENPIRTWISKRAIDDGAPRAISREARRVYFSNPQIFE